MPRPTRTRHEEWAEPGQAKRSGRMSMMERVWASPKDDRERRRAARDLFEAFVLPSRAAALASRPRRPGGAGGPGARHGRSGRRQDLALAPTPRRSTGFLALGRRRPLPHGRPRRLLPGDRACPGPDRRGRGPPHAARPGRFISPRPTSKVGAGSWWWMRRITSRPASSKKSASSATGSAVPAGLPAWSWWGRPRWHVGLPPARWPRWRRGCPPVPISGPSTSRRHAPCWIASSPGDPETTRGSSVSTAMPAGVPGV